MRPQNDWTVRLNKQLHGHGTDTNLVDYGVIGKTVRFSSSGNRLASGCLDGSICVWNVQDLTEPIFAQGLGDDDVSSVCLDELGMLLFSSARIRKPILIWDVANGTIVQELSAHEFEVETLDFFPAQNMLASGSFDLSIVLLDLSNYQFVRRLQGHEGTINCVRFSPDGNQLASASDDHSVRIWRTSTGELLKILGGHTRRVETLQFTLDGEFLWTGGFDATLRLWCIATGLEVLCIPQPTIISAIGMPSHGRIVVVGDEYGHGRVLDARSGSLLASFSVPQQYEGIRSLEFSPQNPSLFVTGSEGPDPIRLWNVDRMELDY